MEQRLHFISGLPRSGSTLLAAILKQNPRFHASISSPVGSLFMNLVAAMSPNTEAAIFVEEEQRRAILKGVFDNYYESFRDSQVIFDTNRLWCSKMPAIEELFPQSKVVCCVRDVPWIMDSFERAIRKNPLQRSKLFNDGVEADTVYSRVETLGQRNRLVGFAYSALKDAFYGEQAGSLLLVDYDLLTASPKKTVSLIYEFLEEEAFEHDFENVDFSFDRFDESLGLPGLHHVSGKVEAKERTTILPPDLFEQYAGMSFWHNPAGSRANVIAKQKKND